MPSLDHDEIAARIRACRAYAGLTRKELAEQMATSPSTVERWEKAHAGSLGGDDRVRGQMLLWDIAKTCGLDPAWAISDWDVPPSYSLKESDFREVATRLRRIEQAVGVEARGPINEADIGISIAEFMEMIGEGSFPWTGGADSPAVKRFVRLLDHMDEADPEAVAKFRRYFGAVDATEPPAAAERPEDVADEIQRQATDPDARTGPPNGSPGEDDSRDTGQSR
jgi:transcriptional regulator with XRE-family HTH domain